MPALAATVIGLAAVAVLGAGIVVGRASSLLADWRDLAGGDLGSSLGLRVGLWRIGIDLIAENPVVGYGPQWARDLIRDGFRERFGMTVDFSHFHNGFLTAWIESGLAGVAALFAVLAVAAANAVTVLKRSRAPTEIFGAALLAITVMTYVVHGMTGLMIGHDIPDAVLVMLLILGTALTSGSHPEQQASEDAPRDQPPDRRQDQKA